MPGQLLHRGRVDEGGHSHVPGVTRAPRLEPTRERRRILRAVPARRIKTRPKLRVLLGKSLVIVVLVGGVSRGAVGHVARDRRVPLQKLLLRLVLEGVADFIV